jgi:hypothetical protein
MTSHRRVFRMNAMTALVTLFLIGIPGLYTD